MRSIVLTLLLLTACSGELVPTDGDTDGDNTVDGGDTVAQVDAGAEPTAVAYRTTIQEDLDRKNCSLGGGCHSGSAPMRVFKAPATEDHWQANYDEVKSRAGNTTESPLVELGLGRQGHPPTALKETDPEVARWLAWVEAGAPYELEE